ncbi:hypothetical protein [Nocardia pseudobrasiliensis]|uniref:Condensation domain-containing protein n=1 Tax=Nocardia pseudobrasiliensis TaxID=45979 RepID=A0A370HZ72_9NOCA|nr:hypothetical protein [Nocardia pseudobrasiliensis]RDI63803.1 hypothetical protein DFR76_109143 [Nocardia pseudobrasiliensis]
MELRSTGIVTSAPWHADTVPVDMVAFALRFTGYLYAVGLRDAFADLIARHEPLRTIDPDGAYLVLSPDTAPVPDLVPVVISRAESAGAVEEFVAREVEPATTAPVRARSFRITGDLDAVPEHLLVIVTTPHAIDRISPARLSRDLMTAYAARRRNRAPRWDHPRPHHQLHVHELQHVQLMEHTAVEARAELPTPA